MSASFDVADPIVFTAGTVGEPGQRVFYLQAQGDGLVVTPQVREAAGRRARRLPRRTARRPSDRRAQAFRPTLLDLVEPSCPEWTVGTLAVA